MSSYKGIIYAVLSSAAFGLGPIFAKYAYANGSNATSVLFFRYLIAGIMLTGYLLFKKKNIRVSRDQFIALMLIGSIGYTVTTITLFMSYVTLGAGLATTLHFVYPALVCLIGFFAFKERVSRAKLMSLILAGLGVYSLIAFEENSLDIAGVTLAIVSGVAYAINIICFGFKTIKPLDSKVSTMYVSYGAAIGTFVYGMFSKQLIFEVNAPVAFSCICLAAVSTIFAMGWLLRAIDMIGATSASILATFEPIVSIIFGVIVFGESLTFALVIGTILIIISTIVLAREK